MAMCDSVHLCSIENGFLQSKVPLARNAEEDPLIVPVVAGDVIYARVTTRVGKASIVEWDLNGVRRGHLPIQSRFGHLTVVNGAVYVTTDTTLYALQVEPSAK